MFRKYYESGYSVIPLVRDEKFPCTPAWQLYCDKQAPESKIDAWDRLHNIGFNGIGVCLGYNDLIAIDYDCNNQELRQILPPSPVMKTGNPERACAFYRGKIAPLKIRGVVEVLGRGNQTVLPSTSLHPITKKPYTWMTPDTLLDVSVHDLPELTEQDIDRLVTAARKLEEKSESSSNELDLSFIYTNDDPTRESPHNSQSRLKKLCAALISKNMSSDEAVAELLRYDNEHHKPVGYFSENGRTSDQHGDAYTSALSFYANMLKSINSKRIRNGDEPHVPNLTESVVNISIGESSNKQERTKDGSEVVDSESNSDTQTDTLDTDCFYSRESKLTPFPEPMGIMKSIFDDILLQSPVPQPTFALASALTIMSGFAIGRYHFNGINPAIYSLILGETGIGKDIAKSYTTAIFTHEKVRRHYNILGLSRYVSAPAFLSGFPTQRARVDILDEFSSFLKAISRKEGVHREIATQMAELYSMKNNQYFAGSKALGRKETFECYGPILTILALCQPDTFINSVTSDFTEHGGLPRFLIFNVDSKPEFNEKFMTNMSNSKVNNIVSQLIQTFPNKSFLEDAVSPDPGQLQVQSKNMGVTSDALSSLGDIMRELYYKGPRYSRVTENVYRLSMLSALSRGEFNPSLGNVFIEQLDVEWAREVAMTSIENAASTLKQASALGDYEKIKEKYRSFFKKQPVGEWIKSTKYLNRVRSNLSAKAIYDILDHLCAEGLLKKQNGPFKTYARSS